MSRSTFMAFAGDVLIRGAAVLMCALAPLVITQAAEKQPPGETNDMTSHETPPSRC